MSFRDDVIQSIRNIDASRENQKDDEGLSVRLLTQAYLQNCSENVRALDS